MADEVRMGSITIEGLKDVELALLGFSDKLAKQVLAGGIRAGAVVIQKQAREYAPKSITPHLLRSKKQKFGVWVYPGNLKKMIRVKVDKSQTRGYKITYEIYVKNKEAWYWKFVEFGTSKMYGRTFMRSAFETMKEQAILTVKEYVLSRIEDGGKTLNTTGV
jgi:HK97 gp10 family phage protein